MEEVIASTYRIIKKLGSGGGGNVYLADHLRQTSAGLRRKRLCFVERQMF